VKNEKQDRRKLCKDATVSTNAINAGTRWNFWKKAAVATSTLANAAKVQICKNYCQVLLQGTAVAQHHRATVPALPALVHCLRKDKL